VKRCINIDTTTCNYARSKAIPSLENTQLDNISQRRCRHKIRRPPQISALVLTPHAERRPRLVRQLGGTSENLLAHEAGDVEPHRARRKYEAGGRRRRVCAHVCRGAARERPKARVEKVDGDALHWPNKGWQPEAQYFEVLPHHP
jgi:hypothetical protein